MRLTIFGATGRTGQHLVEQALAAGHHVTVLVRDPSKIGAQATQLKIVVGTLPNSGRVEQAVSGAEAVLSVLGPSHNRPTYDISTGTANILAAMQTHNVHRLILSAGAGVGDPQDRPGLGHHVINALVKVFAGHVYDDMVQMVATVRASNLDWTIVRVPRLTEGPRTGTIRVGAVGRGTGTRLSRADLAGFMLTLVKDSAYRHQAPVISN